MVQDLVLSDYPAVPGIHLALHISTERPCELFLPCGVMQQGHALKTSENVSVAIPQKAHDGHFSVVLYIKK